jgi:Xaa-Pro aminopeptidase
MRTLVFLLCLLSLPLAAQEGYPAILSLERQGELHDAWLAERAKTVLPNLMRRADIDTWVLISREYNEDPVLNTMLPSKWMGARRTTILMVHDPGEGKPLETLACARYGVGDVFKQAWFPEQQPDQWAQMVEILDGWNSQKIAVNRSEHFGLADGLSAYHYDKLQEVLPEKYRNRIVSGEPLAIGWLETRIPSEMVVYKRVMAVAHAIIAEAFSDAVITPGVTTTDEVVWFMRERTNKLGMGIWFHPTVDVQRAEQQELYAFSGRPGKTVIQPGDLLHCDFGITYCGLNTDTQHNAYVLKAGEDEPPAYLVEAFGQGMQTMDVLTDQYQNGRTGNQLLSMALAEGKKQGLRPTIYTHPIGYHGHGAGPTVGLWDQQGGVPVRGDYPLYPNTAYSIELNTKVYIDEWNQDLRMMMEEDGFWDGEKFQYIDGRQKELYLVH